MIDFIVKILVINWMAVAAILGVFLYHFFR